MGSVCAAAQHEKIRLNTSKDLSTTFERKTIVVGCSRVVVCVSLWSIRTMLFRACRDQRCDHQSLTQVQSTSFLLLNKQNQKVGLKHRIMMMPANRANLGESKELRMKWLMTGVHPVYPQICEHIWYRDCPACDLGETPALQKTKDK